MAIIKLTRDLFEHASVLLKPQTHFISSSMGITGSEFLKAVRTKRIKTISDEISSYYFDAKEAHLAIARETEDVCPDVDVSRTIDSLMTAVEKSPTHKSYLKSIPIKRIVANETYALGKSFSGAPDSDIFVGMNSFCANTLTRHYSSFTNPNFAYTNYNCLNFFTASTVASNTGLIYANPSKASSNAGKVDIDYNPSDAFTVNFWINPRYTSDSVYPDNEFKTGTILQISSSMTISLMTGSSRDQQGYPDKFEILTQFCSSSDVAPSKAIYSDTAPYDLVFSSSKNALERNRWYNVTVRWSSLVNDGTGSIRILTKLKNESGSFDTVKSDTSFIIPSASILDSDKVSHSLCIGNFFEGAKDSDKKIFNDTVHREEGIPRIGASSAVADHDPVFAHPLNAEVSDIKLYHSYLFDDDIENIAWEVKSLKMT